ncbi:hypothetical protein ACFQE1_02130 [Halobium palmae]|uniref:AAA+ ATPase domain-containing protein n=1 Tax=Halobium palmae TaxID=1776492 RepID=A0ABD5RUW6_9EURY
MSSNTEDWTSSDLRSALSKLNKAEEVGAVEEAVAANARETMSAMLRLKMHYDPNADPVLPDEVEDCVLYKRLKARLETNRAYDAVRAGDISSMRYLAGRQWDEGMDTSSWRVADVLTNDLWKPNDRDNMLNLILYGPTPSIAKGSNTGTGKSDFAYLISEGGERAYKRIGQSLQIASNNDTDPYQQVEKWSEAEGWMQEMDGPKLLILDEAAQGLKNKDMTAGDVLGKAIRLMRKYNCHLILISHTGKDIPLDIRRQVVFARKGSKKTATLGNKLEEDSSGEMQIKNVEYDLKNIPPTDVKYDSYDDRGEFEWDIDEDDSTEEESEPTPQCQAKTKAGSRCPNDAKRPTDDPRVCKNHTPDDIPDDEDE